MEMHSNRSSDQAQAVAMNKETALACFNDIFDTLLEESLSSSLEEKKEKDFEKAPQVGLTRECQNILSFMQNQLDIGDTCRTSDMKKALSVKDRRIYDVLHVLGGKRNLH